MATLVLDQAIKGLPELIAVSPHIWLDYDQEADVLYLSFRRPQQATDSELEDHFIYHLEHDIVKLRQGLRCVTGTPG